MFRFTIRELVMLTLIVGLALGLWVAQLQYTALRNELDRLKDNEPPKGTIPNAEVRD